MESLPGFEMQTTASREWQKLVNLHGVKVAILVTSASKIGGRMGELRKTVLVFTGWKLPLTHEPDSLRDTELPVIFCRLHELVS